MRLNVLFFASLRDDVGTDALTLDLPDADADAGGLDALFAALATKLSEAAMEALRGENVRLAINQELITPPRQLADGDEIAFLPPVTGG